MKMLRNKKALSPVIATIILIAVTVAVSLAVAAWMGALTFSFTSTESMTYTSFLWGTNAAGHDTNITLTAKNTGSGTSTIANVEQDGATATYKINGTSQGTLLMPKGSSAKIVITYAFVSGIEYNFMVVTAKGNQFGPYTLAAP
jgi:flagellin-like protein